MKNNKDFKIKYHITDGAGKQNITVIYNTILEMVRQDGRDLTARQMTTILSVYLDDEILTVTILARLLNVARPAVTRILDRLVDANLVRRVEDRQDRRRILIRRTRDGKNFIETLTEIARKAGESIHLETA